MCYNLGEMPLSREERDRIREEEELRFQIRKERDEDKSNETIIGLIALGAFALILSLGLRHC